MSIKTTDIVVGEEAPDHIQHMATDINNALARITTASNTLIDALEARIAALEAREGQYGR